ncbi:hypothetical protein K1718_02670 [Roseibium porphyridii]|uniref:Uncharacterized protein n=1 Tax=Roseibium porphyridii TaxID=2866279 RepID=A0ABY8F802_9HYPH|nr:hypothetical protein [Roseibium sp. KMA01]WFE90272.1 hypothetical protein K1718_02670 [Roseibium sp. KMA01]
MSSLELDSLCRARVCAFAAPSALIKINDRLGLAANRKLESNGSRLTDIFAGAAHNALQRKAIFLNFGAPDPAFNLPGDQRARRAGFGTAIAKRARAQSKINDWKAVFADSNDLLRTGRNAIAALCT